ncbi:molybdopterin-dependent oxidoreductase [Sandaracinobacteroides saxicola]|uniref:Molybdopterin-dependent oxidoreductase n=1 Tax=Sandaracinobacteroides saxicola TaxID=2759707 RepID=A0A7G5IKH2_9SPHN|nr:molybdopterin-dependent oxidoreductase [Sandaracinobacteroides saxicola]QMW23864.1 molybdopterin-dependent oxidoreductase [Sandaracinobacteroides saxicola]
MTVPTSRRALLGLGAATLVAGCDRLATAPATVDLLGHTEKLTKAAQRLLIGRTALAAEFDRADISRNFRANGSINVDDIDYQADAARGFPDWRLEVTGLVKTPLSLSLADLRALPQRAQITRHDCVEGWSAIAEWQGPQLGALLARAGLLPNARYAVFHCADNLGGGLSEGDRYYESIDLIDAFHPQTILAHRMNGAPLGIPHGAPLRLRVERQLGYKQAKYILRIDLVDSFAALAGGKGGFWEDRGYEWYAGI